MTYPYHIRDVHISDPFILADPATRKYYTYVQFVDAQRFPHLVSSEPCFYALASEDLIHWSEPKICFRQGGFWASQDYWAPEMHIWKSRYYLISSFRAPGTYRRCQCLVGDSALGPFTPDGQPLTPDGWHCLDGTLYQDRKGRPWLVFCHEWLQVCDGQVAAVPLSDDLGSATGDPVILFRASDAPWRAKSVGSGGHGFVTDGPFLYRMRSGALIMLWSNFIEGGGYTTGYARSKSGDILGPWIQESDPLYALDGAHSMLFHTFEGQLMMALHCPNDHPRKRILLFEMAEEGDRLRIVNEVTGNWYNNIGGIGRKFAYEDPIVEAPHFTHTASPAEEEAPPQEETQ
jgi:beta-xylosidase